jgi:enamine deaminase RidA (YjgF/YER057c/UK114 family)
MTQSYRYLENPDAVHPPVGRYSHLARFKASETLVLAGQVAIDLEGRLVGEGDVAAQTRQVFDNIGRILESAGASFDNVVEFTTYVVGRESVQPYLNGRTGIFDEIFPGRDYPPNTLLVISGLVREDMLVEISTVAVLT